MVAGVWVGDFRDAAQDLPGSWTVPRGVRPHIDLPDTGDGADLVTHQLHSSAHNRAR